MLKDRPIIYQPVEGKFCKQCGKVLTMYEYMNNKTICYKCKRKNLNKKYDK